MIEHHPYGDFFPKKAKDMIIGSFPIGKFTNPHRREEFKEHEIDFFFGGEKNLLWSLIASVFKIPLKTKKDIVYLLSKHGIAIGDLILSCERIDGSASDSQLRKISWNYELLRKIRAHNIRTVLFTSRGVEKWFNHLFPHSDDLKKINLLSPSAQTLRSLPRQKSFRNWKKKYPNKKTMEFLLENYQAVLRELD